MTSFLVIRQEQSKLCRLLHLLSYI